MRALVPLLFLLAFQTNAQQSNNTVFGLELGDVMSIPECQLNKKTRVYVPEIGSCFKRDQVRDQSGKFVDAEGPLGDERLEIYFAYESKPEIVSGFKIFGTVRAGKLTSIGTRTGGVGTQAQDLAQLEQKYGKPTRLQPQSLQNVMGARYEGILAEWELPSGTLVRLESPDMNLAALPRLGGPNIGTFSVVTAPLRAEQAAKEKDRDSKRTKL
jgi:hypothetical protein